jgi:hypothetical protein
MRSLGLLLLLGCSACSSLEGAQQAAQECHEHQMPITVGGTQEQAEVLACLQADDSWRITQTTPGLPAQVYTVPPYVADPHTSQ